MKGSLSGTLLQTRSPANFRYAPIRLVEIPASKISSGHRHDKTGARKPGGQSNPGEWDRTPNEWLFSNRPGRELTVPDLAIERGREPKLFDVKIILEILTHWFLS